MKRIAGALVLLSLLGLGTTAAAETNPERSAAQAVDSRTAKLFSALDRNTDGAVTRDELVSTAYEHVGKQVRKRFAQLDKNHDGRITRHEVAKLEAARFSRYDLNRDGQWRPNELYMVMYVALAKRLERLYASLDADGDGLCTASELGSHRQAVAARQAKAGDRQVATASAARATTSN